MPVHRVAPETLHTPWEHYPIYSRNHGNTIFLSPGELKQIKQGSGIGITELLGVDIGLAIFSTWKMLPRFGICQKRGTIKPSIAQLEERGTVICKQKPIPRSLVRTRLEGRSFF
jgi:hypothetical protein